MINITISSGLYDISSPAITHAEERRNQEVDIHTVPILSDSRIQDIYAQGAGRAGP